MSRLLSPLVRAVCGATLLATAACGGSNSNPNNPSPTPPAVISESFAGSINPNGAFTHPFAAQNAGSVAATLTTVTPDPATPVGLSLGTWNGVACQVIIANDNIVQGSTVNGTANGAGNFCVRIYDIGRLTSSVSYEITVAHY